MWGFDHNRQVTGDFKAFKDGFQEMTLVDYNAHCDRIARACSEIHDETAQRRC